MDSWNSARRIMTHFASKLDARKSIHRKRLNKGGAQPATNSPKDFQRGCQRSLSHKSRGLSNCIREIAKK
jgi:hypothetical protein